MVRCLTLIFSRQPHLGTLWSHPGSIQYQVVVGEVEVILLAHKFRIYPSK